MLNLEKKYITVIKKILAAYIPQTEVWVYGSRIKNTSHSGSDLDLVIISTVSQKELSLVRNAFSESQLPILVDLLEWETLPDNFKADIQSSHAVIYRPNSNA